MNGKRNGKGKEYNENGILIFEGEYYSWKKWNGKIYFKNEIYEIKNGKGFIREYIEYEKIIFEGTLLEGKRNGKGKEYNYQGKLVFEGEYLNGKKLKGKGKESDSNGKIIFKGEY